MRPALGLVLVVVAACGQVDEHRHLDGGGSGSDASPDARVPSCLGVPFSAPAPVTELNSTAPDEFLRLSSDELTAYFSRIGSAAPTMGYVATRTSTTAAFGAVATLQMTGSTSTEVLSPSVTADGLTILFTSSRQGGQGGVDVWMATRAATTTNFGTITNVSGVNSAGVEEDVYVVPDGSAIYFTSDRNAGIPNVFRADKSGSTYSGPVVVLSDATMNMSVSRVVISADELTMFYQWRNDIHEIHRNTKTESWTLQATTAPEINTQNAEHPTWISNDGCRLYFETDRPGTQQFDLYRAVRTPQ